MRHPGVAQGPRQARRGVSEIDVRLLEKIGNTEETAQEVPLKVASEVISWTLARVKDDQACEVHELLLENRDRALHDRIAKATMKVWIKAR
jgi:hypothetical protein